MKLNGSEKINSMDLNNKIIASLQTNISPGRYNLKLQTRLTLKTVPPNSFSKIHIRFNLLQFCTVPPFVYVFAVLLKCSFTVLSCCFHILLIQWPFSCV